MNPEPRQVDDETKKAVEEYLAKGGKITKYPYGKRTEDITYTGGFYTKRKKKKEDEAGS